MNTTFIETERLLLRKPVITDADDIFQKYARDFEVTKYLKWKPHRKIRETYDFLDSCIMDFDHWNHITWCLVKKEDNRLIGMFDLLLERNMANFGYVLMKSEWNKGYMTESLKKVIEYAFTLDSIYRVCGLCDVENIASAKVMEKAGLLREGILKKYSLHPNISTIPRDVYSYSIIK